MIDNIMTLFLPLFVGTILLCALVIYSLMVALNKAIRQICRVNELLLVFKAHNEGGPDRARALITAQKTQTAHKLPGIAGQTGQKPTTKPDDVEALGVSFVQGSA